MARRTRSFLFDNISKRLVQNTNKTAKEINTRKAANTVANTDILTSLETDTKISTTISNTGINTLSDISIANVVSDQVLQYNANTGNWENETLSLVSSVDGLTDTNLTSLSDGDYLVYSSSGSEWVNRSLDLSSYVTDTDIAAYSNTAQMNTAIAASNTLMTTYVDDQVANVSVDLSSYSTTTQMNTAIASSNTAMKNYVDAEVAGIVNSAPTTLDTLNELAAALGDDPDFATTTATNIGTKLAKSSNLSDLTNAATARTNLGLGTAATTASTDYATSAQGTKADTAYGWGNHASAGYGTSSFSGAYADLSGKPTIPTNNNQLTNGAGYLTSFDITTQTDSKYVRSDVDDNKVGYLLFAETGTATSTVNYPSHPIIMRSSGWDTNNAYARSVDWYIRAETVSSVYPDGDLVFYEETPSYAHEKMRLHGRGSGGSYQDPNAATFKGNVNILQTSDSSGGDLTVTGTVTATGGNSTNWNTAYSWGNHASAGYGTSNFSGSYNDLSNRPTIPTNNNQLTNGAGYITSNISANINMNNYSITNLNDISFNDPGPDEGIKWIGGSDWRIYESPDNLTTNSGGNLQFVTGTTRRMTLGTSNLWLSGDFDIVGDVKAAGQIRATGWWNNNSSDVSGYAVEIGWSGGEGYLLSYSRTAGAYGAMNYSAASHDFTNGNVRLKAGKYIDLETSAGSIRGYIQATDTNDQHLIIATSGGEDIAFKDGGLSGDSNLIVRGDGNIWVRGSILNGTMAYSQLTGTPTIPTNNNQLTNGAGYITNGSSYNVNDAWLRENGDNADVKLYGNSRQMTFRTDGVSGGTGGHTGYPFRWTYGGNADSNSEMLLNTSGQLWLANYGWLHDAFLRKNATDTQTNTINMNGYFVGGADGHRHKGIYGNYNSYRINNIWSMGTSYVVDSNGGSFGNLYGMAYTYNNRVYTSNAMGGGHQMVWCQNGGPNCALGSNIWTSGNVTAYSDIRVKENLEIIPNALEKVKKLNGYTFDRTDIEIDNEGNTPRKRQAGVVAQEVLKVLPEVVTGNETNPDGHLSVAYGNMVALLIEAIKEQQEQIEELKARLQ